MNQKTAKILRQIAGFKPSEPRVLAPVSVMKVVTDKEGKETFKNVPTRTLRNDPNSARAKYQQLKRQYKGN